MKFLTVVLSCVVFVTQCLLAYAPETNLLPPISSASFSSSSNLNSNSKSKIQKVLDRRLSPVQTVISHLPAQYGSVRHVLEGDPNNIVVHIQDIHMNHEAQQNIGNAIAHLSQNQKVDLLALEGAFDKINIQPYRQYSHPPTLKKLAHDLLQENHISGPIHASLLEKNEVAPIIIGVDDKVHYEKNVEAVQKSWPLREQLKKKTMSIAMSIAMSKAKTFSKNLHSFDQIVEQYRQEEIDLGDYLSALTQHNIDTTTPIDILIELIQMESALDFSKVQRQRAALIAHLGHKLSAAQVSILRNTAMSFKLGKMTHAQFYSHLQTICDHAQISLRHYPAMRDYMQYVLLADSVNMQKVMQDIQILETQVYAKLIQTPAEQALVQKSRKNYLTQKLINFALTKDEWNEYRRGVPVARPETKSQKKVLMHLGEPPARPYITFEKFYEEAEIRDQKISENLIAAIQNNNAKLTILVTGGFHSAGIHAATRQHGNPATIIQFTPKITKINSQNSSEYLSIFTQQKKPLSQLLKGEKLFLAQNPMSQETMFARWSQAHKGKLPTAVINKVRSQLSLKKLFQPSLTQKLILFTSSLGLSILMNTFNSTWASAVQVGGTPVSEGFRPPMLLLAILTALGTGLWVSMVKSRGKEVGLQSFNRVFKPHHIVLLYPESIDHKDKRLTQLSALFARHINDVQVTPIIFSNRSQGYKKFALGDPDVIVVADQTDLSPADLIVVVRDSQAPLDWSVDEDDETPVVELAFGETSEELQGITSEDHRTIPILSSKDLSQPQEGDDLWNLIRATVYRQLLPQEQVNPEDPHYALAFEVLKKTLKPAKILLVYSMEQFTTGVTFPLSVLLKNKSRYGGNVDVQKVFVADRWPYLTTPRQVSHHFKGSVEANLDIRPEDVNSAGLIVVLRDAQKPLDWKKGELSEVHNAQIVELVFGETSEDVEHVVEGNPRAVPILSPIYLNHPQQADQIWRDILIAVFRQQVAEIESRGISSKNVIATLLLVVSALFLYSEWGIAALMPALAVGMVWWPSFRKRQELHQALLRTISTRERFRIIHENRESLRRGSLLQVLDLLAFEHTAEPADMEQLANDLESQIHKIKLDDWFFWDRYVFTLQAMKKYPDAQAILARLYAQAFWNRNILSGEPKIRDLQAVASKPENMLGAAAPILEPIAQVELQRTGEWRFIHDKDSMRWIAPDSEVIPLDKARTKQLLKMLKHKDFSDDALEKRKQSLSEYLFKSHREAQWDNADILQVAEILSDTKELGLSKHAELYLAGLLAERWHQLPTPYRNEVRSLFEKLWVTNPFQVDLTLRIVRSFVEAKHWDKKPIPFIGSVWVSLLALLSLAVFAGPADAAVGDVPSTLPALPVSGFGFWAVLMGVAVVAAVLASPSKTENPNVFRSRSVWEAAVSDGLAGIRKKSHELNRDDLFFVIRKFQQNIEPDSDFYLNFAAILEDQVYIVDLDDTDFWYGFASIIERFSPYPEAQEALATIFVQFWWNRKVDKDEDEGDDRDKFMDLFKRGLSDDPSLMSTKTKQMLKPIRSFVSNRASIKYSGDIDDIYWVRGVLQEQFDDDIPEDEFLDVLIDRILDGIEQKHSRNHTLPRINQDGKEDWAGRLYHRYSGGSDTTVVRVAEILSRSKKLELSTKTEVYLSGILAERWHALLPHHRKQVRAYFKGKLTEDHLTNLSVIRLLSGVIQFTPWEKSERRPSSSLLSKSKFIWISLAALLGLGAFAGPVDAAVLALSIPEPNGWHVIFSFGVLGVWLFLWWMRDDVLKLTWEAKYNLMLVLGVMGVGGMVWILLHLIFNPGSVIETTALVWAMVPALGMAALGEMSRPLTVSSIPGGGLSAILGVMFLVGMSWSIIRVEYSQILSDLDLGWARHIGDAYRRILRNSHRLDRTGLLKALRVMNTVSIDKSEENLNLAKAIANQIHVIDLHDWEFWGKYSKVLGQLGKHPETQSILGEIYLKAWWKRNLLEEDKKVQELWSKVERGFKDSPPTLKRKTEKIFKPLIEFYKLMEEGEGKDGNWLQSFSSRLSRGEIDEILDAIRTDSNSGLGRTRKEKSAMKLFVLHKVSDWNYDHTLKVAELLYYSRNLEFSAKTELYLAGILAQRWHQLPPTAREDIVDLFEDTLTPDYFKSPPALKLLQSVVQPTPWDTAVKQKPARKSSKRSSLTSSAIWVPLLALLTFGAFASPVDAAVVGDVSQAVLQASLVKWLAVGFWTVFALLSFVAAAIYFVGAVRKASRSIYSEQEDSLRKKKMLAYLLVIVVSTVFIISIFGGLTFFFGMAAAAPMTWKKLMQHISTLGKGSPLEDFALVRESSAVLGDDGLNQLLEKIHDAALSSNQLLYLAHAINNEIHYADLSDEVFWSRYAEVLGSLNDRPEAQEILAKIFVQAWWSRGRTDMGMKKSLDFLYRKLIGDAKHVVEPLSYFDTLSRGLLQNYRDVTSDREWARANGINTASEGLSAAHWDEDDVEKILHALGDKNSRLDAEAKQKWSFILYSNPTGIGIDWTYDHTVHVAQILQLSNVLGLNKLTEEYLSGILAHRWYNLPTDQRNEVRTILEKPLNENLFVSPRTVPLLRGVLPFGPWDKSENQKESRGFFEKFNSKPASIVALVTLLSLGVFASPVDAAVSGAAEGVGTVILRYSLLVGALIFTALSLATVIYTFYVWFPKWILAKTPSDRFKAYLKISLLIVLLSLLFFLFHVFSYFFYLGMVIPTLSLLGYKRLYQPQDGGRSVDISEILDSMPASLDVLNRRQQLVNELVDPDQVRVLESELANLPENGLVVFGVPGNLEEGSPEFEVNRQMAERIIDVLAHSNNSNKNAVFATESGTFSSLLRSYIDDRAAANIQVTDDAGIVDGSSLYIRQLNQHIKPELESASSVQFYVGVGVTPVYKGAWGSLLAQVVAHFIDKDLNLWPIKPGHLERMTLFDRLVQIAA